MTRIEHFALSVQDPVAVGRWYVENLGCTIARATGAPVFEHFIADQSGNVMIEIYNNPQVAVPDYHAMDPLLLHIAFAVEDPEGTRDALVQAGASIVQDLFHKPNGDALIMMRDPWGLALQLVKRVAE